MTDITITLTPEESNLVNHFFTKMWTDYEKGRERIKRELDINGSLEGVFGPEIEESDRAVLESYANMSKFYMDLADKFPFTE